MQRSPQRRDTDKVTGVIYFVFFSVIRMSLQQEEMTILINDNFGLITLCFLSSIRFVLGKFNS